MQSWAVLGTRVDDCDSAEATKLIAAAAHQPAPDRPMHVVTLGTEMVVLAQRDERFRAVVNSCGLSLCDTVGLLLASRLRRGPLRERVAGVELVEKLCGAIAGTPAKVFLLGGAPGVADSAAAALQARHPGLSIAGVRDGYFRAEESPEIVAQIRGTGAGLLLVGLGSPKQEFWLNEYLSASGCGAGIGVGGSFDVICGKVQRAPQLWRALGLEWLYRLVREPRRWRRQLALPLFVALLGREMVVLFIQRRFGRA